MKVFKNALPLINGKLSKLSDITVHEERIIDISPANSVDCKDYFDCKGNILVSGYIDIHTHGGYGFDVMDASAEALEAISNFHLDNGTTTYIPTTLTADIKSIVKAILNVKDFKNNKTARRYGVHLEGPFISLKAPGAHPPKYILNPDTENTKWVFENARMVSRITVAPDNSGAAEFTRVCNNHKIQVSAGHDQAIDDEIYAMIENGCSSVTHMYNCTSRPSRRLTPHKHLGLTEIGLISDKLICEVISDNRHVPNDLFKMIYKLKGPKGIALVSDSLAVAGFKGGEMYLGSGDSKQRIVVEDGVAIIPELNTYAGSITPICNLVKNIYSNVGIPLEDCLTMGTLTPANLMKMEDRGDIQKGYLADFNILDKDANILHTFLGGNAIK